MLLKARLAYLLADLGPCTRQWDVIIELTTMIFCLRSSYTEFSSKHGRDDRFKAIEKPRDRETYFNEFIAEVRKREKEEKEKKREQVSHEEGPEMTLTFKEVGFKLFRYSDTFEMYSGEMLRMLKILSDFL